MHLWTSPKTTLENSGTMSPLTKQLMLSLRFDSADEDLSSVITPNKLPTPGSRRTPRCINREIFKDNRNDGEKTQLRRFSTFESRRSFFSCKRTLDILESSPEQTNKRNKLTDNQSFSSLPKKEHDGLTSITQAMEAVLQNDGITGDGQKKLGLPIIPGNHNDLNIISPETLADLIGGTYSESIGSYRIIDCRYPYEFDGGHIQGAENIYTEEGILELLYSRNKDQDNTKRHILIFHCEFSSERGPKKCRFLRNRDRDLNKENYPLLNFPEIYLLHQGYKEFYATNKTLCQPQSYKPMLDKDHTNDLKFFRKKSKSMTAGAKKFARNSLRF